MNKRTYSLGLSAAALVIAGLVAAGRNAWWLISMYWVMVFARWVTDDD